MIPVILVTMINGQIALFGIDGQPFQGEEIKSITYQSKPILVTPKREKVHHSDYDCEKDSRRKKNLKAKANDNKWKSLKRKKK